MLYAMFSKIRTIVGHSLVRSAVVLQLGSVGAMLVQAVANVILARLLGPTEFGRYAIVMSIAMVGSVFLGAGAADAMAPILSRAHHNGDDRGVREALLFLGKFVVASACLVLLLGLLTPSIAQRLY
jgi:O-antigen/teichoic acid export membrane protein